MGSKCKLLKDLINSDKLSFLMECHNGLSARIVEESGFEGGWISGLSLSAQAGVRDRNELSFKEVADLCYYICSRVSIPMLLDMDTGYGDYNTASTAIKMIEKSGVAGVCIEDKLFPKHNSFLNNSGSDLEDAHKFAGKIKAIKDSVEDPDFVVVARLEEFISGAGADEALRRAVIYANAGADAILVHSKKSNCSEIDKFMELWSREGSPKPIVIVPTKYYKTPTDHFRDLKISTIIWANHNLRASIKAMQEVSSEIHRSESLNLSEPHIATVSEIFRLQRDSELEEKEKKYVPTNNGTAVILSAKANEDLPKCLTKIDNDTIIDRLCKGLGQIGIKDSVIVMGEGYSDEMTSQLPQNSKVVINPHFKETTEVYSSLLAYNFSSPLTSLPVFTIYGDLVFKDQVYQKFAYSGGDSDVIIGVDPQYDTSKYNEYVKGSPKYQRSSPNDEFEVTGCSTTHSEDSVGSFVGILKASTAKGIRELNSVLKEVYEEDPSSRFVKVIDELSRRCKVSGLYITSNEWLDINQVEEIERSGF